MQRSKFLIIMMAAVLGIAMSAPQSEALVKKPPAKVAASKSAKSAKKTPGKKAVDKRKTAKQSKKDKKHPKKGSKRLKFGKKIPFILSPKTPEVLTPEAPHQHHFSPELVETLARGDLRQTYRSLQLEDASDKVGYMINQVLMAQGKVASHSKSISSFDRATAWHNLYLFLAHQGRPAPKFVKEATKYYQKVARKPQYADKVNVLLAALYATAGDVAKSEKHFSKVDQSALTHANEDYNGLEYLATYYAATKQTQKALTALDMAYKLNPGPLLLWLHVGDDFWAIEEDPAFQDQVATWQIRHKQMLAQLQSDKSTHGARKKAALESRHKKKHGKAAKKSGKKKHR